MTDEQKTALKDTIGIIAPDEMMADENKDLLDFMINDVISRVLIYLGTKKIPADIETILARLVVSAFVNFKRSQSAENNHEIASISDNGQSISYKDRVKSDFATADDDVLFGTSIHILDKYRSVKVVNY